MNRLLRTALSSSHTSKGNESFLEDKYVEINLILTVIISPRPLTTGAVLGLYHKHSCISTQQYVEIVKIHKTTQTAEPKMLILFPRTT